MKSSKIRVRIAPSPTGFVHIGNLRTILYNYLFAKHNKGSFIVRIEDTDQNRLVPGAIEDLLQTLAWAGLEYDEGPKIHGKNIKDEGEFGPYIQSKRLNIYKDHIKTLLDKNKAYYCFCTKDRLEKLREDQQKKKLPPKYDRHCRDLTKEEVKKRLANGEEYVIRFKMPDDKEVVFDDEIRGTIKVNTNDLDDFVLIKADGFPTYHFANIIDDHLMKITHVMRGDEWIASTPKHVLLYEAFGWQPPVFAHLPQLLNKNKKKLSKRDGDVSVKDFIEDGYLKDALLNFIALLGWNAGTEQEIYSMEEMEKQFTLENVHKAGAVFDIDKLNWINGTYLREMTVEDFTDLCLPYLQSSGLIEIKTKKIYNKLDNEVLEMSKLRKICELEKDRIKKLSEIGEGLQFVFEDKLKYPVKNLIWKKSNKKTTQKVLTDLFELLKAVEENEFVKDNLQKMVFIYIEKSALGNGDVLWPMRVALSGLEKSPGPFEIAEALGKEKTLVRLESAIKKLK